MADLMILAQQGDRKAYEQFLNLLASLLLSFIERRMGVGPEVEDVLQETLISIHRARHTYTSGRPIGPWIYTIAENRMIDWLRKSKRFQKLKSALATEKIESHDLHITHPDLPSTHEMLEKLPPRQRNIIRMLKLQELSVAEVAALTGMSKSAVKTTAFRGHEILRRLFSKERK